MRSTLTFLLPFFFLFLLGILKVKQVHLVVWEFDHIPSLSFPWNTIIALVADVQTCLTHPQLVKGGGELIPGTMSSRKRTSGMSAILLAIIVLVSRK